MKNALLERDRILNYAIALAGIITLNFFLPRMMPGDPLHAIYGDDALVAMTPQMQAHLIRQYGLDRSLTDQLLAYLAGLSHADLGYSYYYRDQVSAVIMGALPWTMLLAGLALVIASAIGFLLGTEAASRRGKLLDSFLIAALMFLSGFPMFFVGILLLLIFGVSLGWAPLSGAVTPYAGLEGIDLLRDLARHLALPVVALVLVLLGDVFLITRNAVVTVGREAFISTARAIGCTKFAVKYAHAGRNSLLPVITEIGNRIPHLLIQTLFIEIVFSYPGIGSLLNTAIYSRDYPLIQGILLLMTVLVLTVNLMVDLLYKKLDPRVRYAH
ncbi:MAG TPA: ABC transporter permease [Methanothrix sp.]|nr:ABC transporter permease [Methanothrix sp.]